MVYDFKLLRPQAKYPVYPPYHVGDYLEEYFYKFYIYQKQVFDKTGYTYIPIFWTNVYNNNENRHLIQQYLNALPSAKYFTVSQHDDAVTERLPEGTISFEAGGNKNGIPIPLVCSRLNEQEITHEKNILCSFVGSVIPGSLREQIYHQLKDDKDIYFSPQNWTSQVQLARLEEFINITKQSIFTLCPRGYGAQSFRLYEVMQLGSIPIIIYDKEWFPFSNEINWSEFSVLIHISELSNIKTIVKGINNDQIHQMLKAGKSIYNNYFTLNAVSKQILRILQTK
jgi:hypothetical protein